MLATPPKTLTGRACALAEAMVRLSKVSLAAGLFCLLLLGSSPELQAAPFSEEAVVVVLKDGTELTGVLVRENDDEVAIRSAFGVTTIERSRVKEIRRGENPFRRDFERRFTRAERIGKAKSFSDLGLWADEKGLSAESERAHQKAIEIDPNWEISRGALGHARLDGVWVDAARVAELEEQGYVVKDLNLVKGAPGTTPAKPKPKRELTPEEKKAAEKEEKKRQKLLEKRRKQREEFEEKRRAEFKGVPWANAHKIRSKNYEIICNSTKEVARTYSMIMEALYGALSKRFKQKHLRSGRMSVFVYKTQEEFMNQTGSPRGVGGFYQPNNEQVRAYHGTFGNTSTTYNVLAHEGTHQFQGRVLPNLFNMNNWIIEGFAVYFGDGSRIDYKKKKIVTGIIPRDRLLHIQDKMRDGSYTPLDKLAGLPRNRFSGSHYADSWAILYYLLNGPEKKKGQKMVSQYWLLGTEQRIGQPEFDELAEHYFGSVAELDKAYVDFILDLEPEPAGEVDDDGVFTSYDFMFEVFQPEGDWEFRTQGIRRSELVTVQSKEPLRAFQRLSVGLLSKPDETQSAQDFLDEVLIPALNRTYEDVTSEAVTLNENSGYLIECVDPAPKKKKDKKDGDEDEEEEDDEPRRPPRPGIFGDPPDDPDAVTAEGEATPKIRRKIRAYAIIGVTNVYLIVGESPIKTFDQLVDPFDQFAQSFARIFKNRW